MPFLLKITFQSPIIARLELALRSDVCPFRGDKKKRRVRRPQQNGTEWRQSFQGGCGQFRAASRKVWLMVIVHFSSYLFVDLCFIKTMLSKSQEYDVPQAVPRYPICWGRSFECRPQVVVLCKGPRWWEPPRRSQKRPLLWLETSSPCSKGSVVSVWRQCSISIIYIAILTQNCNLH